MRNFIHYFWTISAMPIASVIPLLSLAFLPFEALHNFLIGLGLSFIMVYFFIRSGFRDDEDRRDLKTLWNFCTMFLAGVGLPFFCLIFLPFHAPYNLLIGLVLSFIIISFTIHRYRRRGNL